jgi:aryl-alcohol dehydrogenase-like predicted oxidoreductase
MKLALGTAQFGLNYGVANKQGKVPYNEVREIIQTAAKAGISTLDTAVTYGDSEAVLGKVGCENFSIVTKLPEVPSNVSNLDVWIENHIHESLTRLDIEQLDGLLLHRPEQLLGSMGGELYKALCVSKQKGSIKRIGISIYDPHELELLLKEFNFDLIQVPFNPFDQRLLTSGWLEKLSALGTAVHLRSIFLQGVLLMTQHERPSKFLPWQKTFNHWDSWLEQTDQSALEACLSHAVNLPNVEKVVVGINSLEHLCQILDAVDNLAPDSRFEPVFDDQRIINPAKWGEL